MGQISETTRWMSDMKRGDTQGNHRYIVVPSVRDVYNDVYHKSMYTKAHEGANLGPAHLACVSFSGAGKVIPRRRKYYDDDKVKNDVALLSGYGETVGAVKEHRMNQEQWFRNVMDGIRHLKSSYDMPKGSDHLSVVPYSGSYTPSHTPLNKFADYIYGLRDHGLVKVVPRAPFAPSEAVKKAELRADDYDRKLRAHRAEVLAKDAADQDFTPRPRRQATEEEPVEESKVEQEAEIPQEPEVVPEEVEAVAAEPEVAEEPEASAEPVAEEPKEETKEERKLWRQREREAKKLAKQESVIAAEEA